MKSHKLPFSTNTISTKNPLECLYSDVWTSPLVSIDNFKYYLVIVDHFTRYTWFYPLKQKSQVKETFIAFTALDENHFQRKIRTLYSDNGGEFVALRQFLITKGITHLTTPPHTPEHNGISERKHQHIVETGLTLLSKAFVPKAYWTYAFATAIYLINRMPTTVIHGESPYAKLFAQQPNYLKLRVFGCLCFPWTRPYNTNKLDDRSVSCVFLGYSLTQSAYLCLDKSSGRIYVSRHVQFVEDCFPFQKTTTPVSSVPEYTPSQIDSRQQLIPVPTLPLVQASSNLSPRSILHLQEQTSPVSSPPATIERVDSHSRQSQIVDAGDTDPLVLGQTPSSNSSPISSPHINHHKTIIHHRYQIQHQLHLNRLYHHHLQFQ